MIPSSHPRFESLMVREKLVKGFEDGIVAAEGLLAHGRGEAFDYILGEKTNSSALRACAAGAAMLILSQRPVISVNGNTAALCASELVELADATNAILEVNLFYYTKERVSNIVRTLMECGAGMVLGPRSSETQSISGTDSERRMVDGRGIHLADTVLVPLEDGDRTEALIREGKNVITFDLNPLSRTAQAANISIIDNIVRGVKILTSECRRCSKMERGELIDMLKGFDNKANLSAVIKEMESNLSGKGIIA